MIRGLIYRNCMLRFMNGDRENGGFIATLAKALVFSKLALGWLLCRCRSASAVHLDPLAISLTSICFVGWQMCAFLVISDGISKQPADSAFLTGALPIGPD